MPAPALLPSQGGVATGAPQAPWWVGDRPELSPLGPLHLSDDGCSVSEVMNA